MKGPGRKLLNKATGSRALKPKIGPAAAAKAPPDDLETVAHSDTDNRPLTRKDFARMRRVPRVKIIRQALGLTQEEFAERYRIPIGTLRDWEQGRSQPDQPARAYLKVIAAYPDMAAKAHHKAA